MQSKIKFLSEWINCFPKFIEIFYLLSEWNVQFIEKIYLDQFKRENLLIGCQLWKCWRPTQFGHWTHNTVPNTNWHCDGQMRLDSTPFCECMYAPHSHAKENQKSVNYIQTWTQHTYRYICGLINNDSAVVGIDTHHSLLLAALPPARGKSTAK